MSKATEQESKVEVKIINAIGTHKPGAVVSVSDAEAALLCREITKDLGDGKLMTYQNAMLLSDHAALLSQTPATGGKMVVETPVDPIFEARKESLKASAPVHAEDDHTKTSEFDPAFTEEASQPSDEDKKAAKSNKKNRR